MLFTLRLPVACITQKPFQHWTGGVGGGPGGNNACTQKGLAGIENMICDPWVKYSVNSSPKRGVASRSQKTVWQQTKLSACASCGPASPELQKGVRQRPQKKYDTLRARGHVKCVTCVA